MTADVRAVNLMRRSASMVTRTLPSPGEDGPSQNAGSTRSWVHVCVMVITAGKCSILLTTTANLVLKASSSLEPWSRWGGSSTPLRLYPNGAIERQHQRGRHDSKDDRMHDKHREYAGIENTRVLRMRGCREYAGVENSSLKSNVQDDELHQTIKFQGWFLETE